MILSAKFQDQTVGFDISDPIDISIPLMFNGPQPNAFGAPEAVSSPCQAGDLVGDTRQGGSCNFERYDFIPHCSATHTECVGHITKKRISIRNCLIDTFIPAVLITIDPQPAGESDETYPAEFDAGDRLITRQLIGDALSGQLKVPESGVAKGAEDPDFLTGLIIRTLPNGEEKLSQEYGKYVPPFFSTEAMDLIAEAGVRHLLVDLPSIDRIFDGGGLSNHRKFWGMKTGQFDADQDTKINHTVTELIYVPDQIKDCKYLLNLQVAAFESDAGPSRPVLFKVI